MSSALIRVECYFDLAEECRCLAARTFSTQMRNRYLRMAEIYTTLAEAEEIRHTSLRRLTKRGAWRNATTARAATAGDASVTGVDRQRRSRDHNLTGLGSLSFVVPAS
jgi:hypothetical protein